MPLLTFKRAALPSPLVEPPALIKVSLCQKDTDKISKEVSPARRDREFFRVNELQNPKIRNLVLQFRINNAYAFR